MSDSSHTLTARFIAWWKAPPPADPWELEDGFQISDFTDNENILCFNCLCPTHHLNTFCSECGAPIAPYNWLHPWWRIFANGHIARRLVSKPIQRWVYLTIMVFCTFQILAYLSFAQGFIYLGAGEWMDYLSGLLMVLWILGFNLAFAWRATINYYRHRDLQWD